MSQDSKVSVAQHYLRVVIDKFTSLKADAERAMAQLQEQDLHWAMNENSNSVAVIVQHMSGNMISRWTDFLTSDGEKPDRNRDDEFVDSIRSKDDLLRVWNRGWDVFLNTLRSLTADDLLATVTIRNEAHTVLEAIERQMSHYSYHVGQIVYAAKQIRSEEWSTLSIPRKSKK
ncbi:DUF1572 family protein [Paenibacillus dendritiformis]|uniref:DUF1572 family protein n=1 Tax=Paenibacillus TaxID=44249 RepID=UPI001F0FD960|nr:DUF1572 family protein [Paenibacillus dendritiformis]WGU95926.1 DUF1572 family protein [Paenibacillus dendritiformis]